MFSCQIARNSLGAFFGAIILSLGFSSAALADTPPQCGTPDPANITIEPIFDDVQYEFYQPMMQIKQMASSGGTGQQQEQWPVGLATGELFIRTANEIQTRHPSVGGFICGSLKSITVRMGFTDNKVYVAKEFPRRSCPHRTVLQHEERHKTVDRQLLEEYTEKARYLFTNLAQSIGVLAHNNQAMLEAELNGRINEELKKFTDTMNAERARRQALVDSEDEYARVSASCDGQLMDVVNQRLDLIRSGNSGYAARVTAPAAPASDNK